MFLVSGRSEDKEPLVAATRDFPAALAVRSGFHRRLRRARGLQGRASILCVARLGLRASEVTQLRLEDLDWRNASVRVRARKTGHGALLPLTGEVGAALAEYLQHGRPDTAARQVFVLHWLRPGAPVSVSIVGRTLDNARRRARTNAPP